MSSEPLPGVFERQPRIFAPFDDHKKHLPRRKAHPKCTAPKCGFLAHFVITLEDGEYADVCSRHYLLHTDSIHEADD